MPRPSRGRVKGQKKSGFFRRPGCSSDDLAATPCPSSRVCCQRRHTREYHHLICPNPVAI
eukprot:scaffold1411_cov252-Pinguiococcus_pyrenoidosus.AAC.23